MAAGNEGSTPLDGTVVVGGRAAVNRGAVLTGGAAGTGAFAGTGGADVPATWAWVSVGVKVGRGVRVEVGQEIWPTAEVRAAKALVWPKA